MTDNEYASRIYCCVFCTDADDGDSYTRGILDAIGTLTVREQTALESYYRHDNNYKQTGSVIGNISGEAARRIVQKALLKLRHQSRRKNMSVKNIIKDHDKKTAEAMDIVFELRETLNQFIKRIDSI